MGMAFWGGPQLACGRGVDRGWRWCGSCLLDIMGEGSAGCGELCLVDRCGELRRHGTGVNGKGGACPALLGTRVSEWDAEGTKG